jgi:GTP pyrophosphokinase
MELTDRFSEALQYAFALHRGQKRKGTEIPYMGHLLEVAGIVLEYGGGEEEAIAALLHDAVEDQGGAETGEEIRRRFGENVARIVAGCTDTDQTPKPPWRKRKEGYLKRIVRADPSIILVSAADKLHNVRSILKDYRHMGEGIWSRFNGGKAGMLWYHRALVKAYRRTCDLPVVEELDRAVSDLEKLAGEDQMSLHRK